MTERIPLDRMTSDQLDRLYDRLDALAAELTGWKGLLQRSRQMTARHWDTITRVRALLAALDQPDDVRPKLPPLDPAVILGIHADDQPKEH